MEEKLKTGHFHKREYEKILNINEKYNFNVTYAFCISKYLQDKFESNQIKYKNIRELMNEDNIKIFYGDDNKYFDILFDWIKLI